MIADGSVERDVEDWAMVMRFLPAGWREKATELRAMRRARGFADCERLLRTLLIYLVEGCSLKETAVRARYAELTSVSDVAIWKRLRSSGPWFRWMAEEMMKTWVQRLPRDVLPGDYRLRLVDASVVSEPGKTGSEWRMHYSVELGTLQCDFLEVTDRKGGETFKRFPVEPGDLLIADRAYCNRPGVAHVVGQGGDVLVRLSVTNLPLETKSGKPFALLRRLRRLGMGEVGDWLCWTRTDKTAGARIAARVCAIKKSRVAAQRARDKLRRKASKQGRTLRPETIEAAGYIFVLTTVARQVLCAANILEVYRGRWQVELVFKRLKSILGLGHLPKQEPEGAKAWLHAKLFVAFLVEALIHAGETFFPWGYPLEQQGT